MKTETKKFIRGAVVFYAEVLKTLVPTTNCYTYFKVRDEYTEILEVKKQWLGQTISEKEYVLKHRKARADLLDKALKMGDISEEEHKKYLSQQGIVTGDRLHFEEGS